MLFPRDPKQQPQLWDALTYQLEKYRVVALVSGGRGDLSAVSKNFSPDEILALISRMRGASVSRISASRGSAIAPHFSGNVRNRSVFITEFVTNPSTGSLGTELNQLKNDLEVAALSLLFETDAFDSVQVPVRIPPWDTKDLSISNLTEGIEFRKANYTKSR